MNTRRCLVCVLTWIAPLVIIVPIAGAQPTDGPVRRLHGIIDKDQSWSGHVMITDNLKILGATVTVQPGCVIEFAHAVAGSHPVLTVGSDHRDRGELRLLSTADQPITFRTRPETNAGRIIIYVRNRIVPAATSTGPSIQPPVASSEPDRLDWQHVHFDNLGYPHVVGLRSQKYTRFEPCLTFKLIGRGHAVRIANCQFNNTTRLQIDVDDESKISVEDNNFTHSQERSALELGGRRINDHAGRTIVARNHLTAAIVLNSLPAFIRGNILIGPDASVVLREETSSQTTIVGNYVHNTTREDDGRYCLNSENPNARIEDNIFRGATTCVLNGSRHMSGNVFIGEGNLSSPYVRKTRTHQLVAALPVGSLFENNLLLGPAHSLLIPQPLQARASGNESIEPTHIRNNVFDAFADSARAIHLNPIGRPPVKVAVTNNLFLRAGCLIYDEDRTSMTVIYADHNAYAPPPSRKFDQVQIDGITQGQPGWAANDVQRDDITDLALREEPPQRLREYDADLQSGRRTVAQVRQQLFDPYRPQRDSPLIGAGRRIPGSTASSASIGAAPASERRR